MRKLYVMTSLILLVLLFATAADARRFEPMKVYVDMDEWVTDDLLEIYTTVDNDNGSTRLHDVSVRIMIPELGVYYESGEFDVSRRNVKTKTVLVDTHNAPAGEYDVFVYASNDDFSRVKHRVITVK